LKPDFPRTRIRKRGGIHRISELADVSIGTVDRALHGRAGISEATRTKVLRIAKQLHYTPHPAARALARRRPNFRIGVCIPQEIHFFYDQMRLGIFDEARRSEGLGVEVVYRPVSALGKGEARRLEELLDEGVSALVVTPGSPQSVAPVIDRAEQRNVRVVCITTDAPQSRRSGIVCVDPALSGRLASELMTRFVPAGSKVAVITGMLQAEEHRLKTVGFCEGFRANCLGGSVAAILEGHESEPQSFRKSVRLLARHPDLRGIYVNTVNCLPVCRALHRRPAARKIQLITTDLFPEMLPFFQDGTIGASIYQDPYLQGQTAVRLLVDHLCHSAALPAARYLNPGIVLRSNLHLFREARAAGE
jgi:LacI family transcriptional regulator, galactose operon repressor